MAMSALDQKQTCATQKGMSALPPKADTQRSDLMRFQSSIVSIERAPRL